jgi:hypothetical protein
LKLSGFGNQTPTKNEEISNYLDLETKPPTENEEI